MTRISKRTVHSLARRVVDEILKSTHSKAVSVVADVCAVACTHMPIVTVEFVDIERAEIGTRVIAGDDDEWR